MESQDVLGLLGGALTSMSLVPQLFRLFRLKSAREISLPFALLLTAGLVCWLAYGILLGLFPVILWNAISLAGSLAIVYAKIKFDRSPPR